MATRKKPRAPLSERSITAMLMKAHEMAQADTPGGAAAYPFWSRELLADPELLDHAPYQAIAFKIIAAYAAEHPLPIPTAEDIADAVDWKVLLGGATLAQARGIPLEQARRDVLPQARREVAEELGDISTEAVKRTHLRVHRDKRGPR
jgi:hypothetical protein